MKRSTAALIIAILFHLLVLLFFWLLGHYVAEIKPPEKQEEQRVKLSLKERPEVKQSGSAVPPQTPKQPAPPMPRGNQLDKLTKAKPLPKPSEQIKAKPPVPQKPQQKIPAAKKVAPPHSTKPEVAPLPPEKPYIPFMKTPPSTTETPKQPVAEANLSEVPEASQSLFSKLSRKQKIVKTPPTKAQQQRYSQLYDDIKELYGDEFGKLTEGEQKYLIDHQEVMRRLTQAQLNRTGSTDIPSNLRINDENVVEFYLHPNGDMTDFRYLDRSGFHLLDAVTKDTIESVYWRYPRPQQKTLIRYKFMYRLRGY